MLTKAERTTQFILETVAPIFNKNGYYGTSMSDLTLATGLTKGAIYGNFESKEHLALEAFNYNVRKVMGLLNKAMSAAADPRSKLKALSEFYRDYYKYTSEFGGCPFINVGVDSNHQNALLMKRVRQLMKRWKGDLVNIIKDGIKCGQFRKNSDPDKYANIIFAMIEGGAFMTVTMDDSKIMKHLMDQMDKMLESDLYK